MREFESHEYYAIEGYMLAKLAAIAKRLYSEQRMDGDAMRDAAQIIDLAISGAMEIPLEEIGGAK